MGKVQKFQRPVVHERLLDAANPARMGGALLALFDGAIAAAQRLLAH